jgi:general secretion pathway protein J
MNKHQTGFTLLEMLIAITLLSVMMTLLLASMRIAGQNWQSGERKISQNSVKQSSYRFFSQNLTHILPFMHEVTLPDKTTVEKPVFQGRSERMQFISSLPLSALRKGLYFFQLYFDQKQHAVLLRLTPYRNTANIKAETEELITAVNQVHFSYFGTPDPTEEQGGWYDEWQDIDHLPSLIRIEISLSDGTLWPEMIFPLHVNTENIIDIASVQRTQALGSKQDAP